MWSSLNDILFKNRQSKINEKDVKFFVNNYFLKNFNGLLEDYDVILENKKVVIKLHAQNPLIFKEILNRQQEIKENIEKELKTKFYSLEIKLF
ncbi:MAG: hypothetical protein UT37_C0008G0020 [Parcubacteria group bacterium GW2011_GWA2_39_18]|nr:MAG: hypothetical protein UT37_C0008G0020 [Parcubacteria group bacterium GW2011_GWA2_39_18]